MAQNYHMIGGDGQTYGPIAKATLQEWIEEGRVCPTTKIRSDADREWRQASELSELTWPTPDPGSPSPTATAASATWEQQADVVGSKSKTRASSSDPEAPESQIAQATSTIRESATWFYWIGGLTLFNVILHFTGSDVHFAIASSATTVIHLWTNQLESGGGILAFGLDGLVLGTIALLTWLARYGVPQAFLAATVLYALDGLLALYLNHWLSLVFHGYVVWQFYRGYQAASLIQRAK
jgi:hypothetical protein